MDTYITMESQSKRFIPDQIVITAFNGHTDALLSTLLVIPASGLHLLAWNSHFPSTAEKWIWRISSIGVGVAPLVIYFHFLASKYIISYIWVPRAGDPLLRRLQGIIMDKFRVASGQYRIINSRLEMYPLEMIFFCTLMLNMYLYIACSVLLGVVAFTTLRSVPEGSYQTPAWGDYWPHF